VQKTTVFLNSDFHTKQHTFTEVIYTGQNLYDFCLVNLSDMPNELLILDEITGIWEWGSTYAFVNLTTSDVMFESILSLING